MSATNEMLLKIQQLRKQTTERDANALANDALILEHIKPVDIADLAELCEKAGFRSYTYWQQHKGAQQCVNSVHSSTVGMYGEAVVERYFKDLGLHVVANWREWINGIADDTKADLVITGSDGVAIEVEVKTITRATDPKGQVTVKHLEKYANEDKLVVCVRYNEDTQLGYVYCAATATDIKAYGSIEPNLYNQDCYRAMIYTAEESQLKMGETFSWK